MRSYVITSESVTDGHPDKVADQVSDSILDAALTQDTSSHVACETMVSTRMCVVAGEISTNADINYEAVARDTIRRIGYDSDTFGFNADTADFRIHLDPQSPDIAVGVNAAEESRGHRVSRDPLDRQGAGDQGLMFGFACNETPTLMPMAIYTAHRMAEMLSKVRREQKVGYLGPDGKTQVTVEYTGHRPVRIRSVLISSQHTADADRDTQIRPDLLDLVARPVTEAVGFDLDDAEFFVNPTGRFVNGGPNADAGLTGRKVIVDSYGGSARHGGGAFSGKDPSKVDRSGAYAARWVAKNVVAAGAADKCEIQIAYAIGRATPISIMVETFGTEHVDPARIDRAVRDAFDLRPAAILRDLDLLRPIYAKTAVFGHFGRQLPAFTWEQTNRAGELQRVLGL